LPSECLSSLDAVPKADAERCAVQVLQILHALRYQHEVVHGCRIFAKSVTDPLNLHTLIQAVQAPNDRTEVAEYLSKVQQKNLAKLRRRAERFA
jgi:hypothetical protein